MPRIIIELTNDTRLEWTKWVNPKVEYVGGFAVVNAGSGREVAIPAGAIRRVDVTPDEFVEKKDWFPTLIKRG